MTDSLSDAKALDTKQTLAALGVLFASVCFGIVPYFSRNLTDQGLAAHSVAFYRYVITAVILLPAFLRQLKSWRELVWGLCAGAGMGLGWIGYVRAVETIPASTVGVLYMTYPVFTVVIAWAMFADPPSRRALLASGLIFLAAVIAGNPAAVPSQDLPTLILSLAAPLGFGFGICVLVHRLSRIPPLARIASVSLGSVLALSPLVATSTAAEILPTDANTWVMILGIAVVSALVPQLIYTVSSPHHWRVAHRCDWQRRTANHVSCRHVRIWRDPDDCAAQCLCVGHHRNCPDTKPRHAECHNQHRQKPLTPFQGQARMRVYSGS